MHIKTPLKEGTEPEFVRDNEGAERTRMSVNTFIRLSEKFGCVYRIVRTRITDWEKFKKGMEAYKD